MNLEVRLHKSAGWLLRQRPGSAVKSDSRPLTRHDIGYGASGYAATPHLPRTVEGSNQYAAPNPLAGGRESRQMEKLEALRRSLDVEVG